MWRNVAGTRHLLEASRRAGVRRFVFVSSPSVVMDGRDQVDIDESYPYPKRFLSLHSETKAIAEQLERTDVWRFASTLVEMFRLPPIRRKLPAGLLRALARAVDLVWTLPVLARTGPPPLSAYAVALLTRSATYDIGAAARDFGYRPRVDQATGLAHLKEWVDAVGGIRALARPWMGPLLARAA